MALRNIFTPVLLLILFFFSFPVNAQDGLDKVVNPYPNGTGYVSNADDIIDEQTVLKLNLLLKPLDQRDKAQVAVVLLNSIGNQLPKDFATALLRKWGVGNRKKNNGLLVLIVKDQRRIEFEIGYGLEGVLPDMTCKRIQEGLMVPYFKKGDYNTGVVKGLELVVSIINTGIDQSLDQDHLYPEMGWIVFQDILFFLVYIMIFSWYALSEKGKYVTHANSFLWLPFLLFMPLIIVAVLSLATPVIVRWSLFLLITYCCWSIFFSFALSKVLKLGQRGDTRIQQYQNLNLVTRNIAFYVMLFPLPFLIISYIVMKSRLRKLRYEPYESPDGTGQMTLVREGRNQQLSKTEQMEEQLGSVSYDLWQGAGNAGVMKLAYANQLTKVRRCKKCRSMTATKTNSVVEQKASSTRGGLATIEYTCQVCGWIGVVKESTSRKPNRNFFKGMLAGSSSVGGSNASSSSESSSSLGSSSSSGNWGGGSSGGGGSGSSW
ncbi:YgcG family protein [Pedobacter sp. MC2016-24]|uniref:TPM domain-containing protein n=1 Tax=Pedobacter sp. MC2016-24 TaxID=2780090 RepID=UPI001881E222|nr:TPM domain-containing protein [Pedobacter sp. MC2016-24]MBE9600784.1 TPM domain-containing protein [Pedobacter sp. MC2016-24]